MPRIKNHAAEAAKYRTKLREAETMRDLHREANSAAQHDILHYGLKNGVRCPDGKRYRIPNPTDLFAKLHTRPADYFTDDGRLDIGRLPADVWRLSEQRPDLVEREKTTKTGILHKTT